MTTWDEAAQERQRKWLEANPDYKSDIAIRATVLNAKYKANTVEKRRAYQKEWHKRNPNYTKELLARNPEYRTKYNAKKKEYFRRHPERRKRNYLRTTYGITVEQWNEMFAAQGNMCATCGSSSPNTKLGWHTDHCHTTKVVRGILCGSCNITLGHAKDCPDRLRALAQYLEKHKPNFTFV